LEKEHKGLVEYGFFLSCNSFLNFFFDQFLVTKQQRLGPRLRRFHLVGIGAERFPLAPRAVLLEGKWIHRLHLMIEFQQTVSMDPTSSMQVVFRENECQICRFRSDGKAIAREATFAN